MLSFDMIIFSTSLPRFFVWDEEFVAEMCRQRTTQKGITWKYKDGLGMDGLAEKYRLYTLCYRTGHDWMEIYG